MAVIQDESGAIIADESGSNILDEAGGDIGDVLYLANCIGLNLLAKSCQPITVGDVVVFANNLSLNLLIYSMVLPSVELITTWLQNQLKRYNHKPQYKIYIGTSDYNDRVIKYPTIRHSAEKLKSVKIDIPLANADGALNYFYEQTYLLVNSAQIQLGDTHPTSGWEGLPLFTGFVGGVKYNKRQCIIEARDRFWNFSQIKIGDTDSIVEIPSSGGIIPSDIAWTLCTCYGLLDSTQGPDNTDISWTDFTVWASQFSSNNIIAHSRYSGEKITEALDDLARYTDSVIEIGGDGKLHFQKYEEVSSLDYTWTHDELINIEVDVNKRRLVNRQWVYWDYSPDSDYYRGKVYSEDSLSINTFGLHEEIEQRDTIWYVDSISALNIAQRRVSLYAQPPKYFRLTAGFDGVWRDLGETARFVDDFFDITSGAGWRITDRELHLDQSKIVNYLDEATVLDAFYLDIDYLDGDKYLL